TRLFRRQKRCDPFALRLCCLAVAALLGVVGIAMGGLRVGGDPAFVIAKYDFPWRLGDDVVGVDRDFSSTAWSVNDEGRDGVAGGVAAQVFDDLDTLRDGRAEVLQPFREVALVNVVGPDPSSNEPVDELL